MSGFGAGQFDNADGSIECQIQEELHARQANAAVSQINSALGRTGFSNTGVKSLSISYAISGAEKAEKDK